MVTEAVRGSCCCPRLEDSPDVTLPQLILYYSSRNGRCSPSNVFNPSHVPLGHFSPNDGSLAQRLGIYRRAFRPSYLSQRPPAVIATENEVSA